MNHQDTLKQASGSWPDLTPAGLASPRDPKDLSPWESGYLDLVPPLVSLDVELKGVAPLRCTRELSVTTGSPAFVSSS